MSENGTKMNIAGDALALIQETAVKAALPATVPLNAEPNHIYGVVKEADIEPRLARPHPRDHYLDSVASLVEFVTATVKGRHTIDNLAAVPERAGPVVWLDDQIITVVVDDGTRRDKAVLKLPVTPQFENLQRGENLTPHTQAEFVRRLRVDLAGTLPAGSKLLELVRRIKWGSGGETVGELQHGKESMGREISAQCNGTTAFPEEITLAVRVYNVPDIPAREAVRCAVEIFPHEQRFALTPLPMQLPDAVAKVLAALYLDLRKSLPEGVLLYRGCA